MNCEIVSQFPVSLPSMKDKMMELGAPEEDFCPRCGRSQKVEYEEVGVSICMWCDTIYGVIIEEISYELVPPIYDFEGEIAEAEFIRPFYFMCPTIHSGPHTVVSYSVRKGWYDYMNCVIVSTLFDRIG